MTQESTTIDSSDDETEDLSSKEEYRQSFNEVVLVVASKHKAIHPTKHLNTVFNIALGVGLHNFADRVFNRGVVRDQYRTKKEGLLGVDSQVQEKFLLQMRAIFKDSGKYRKEEEPEIVLEESKLNDEKLIQLFNYAFNDNVTLPDAFVIKSGDSVEQKAQVLNVLRRATMAGNLDIRFLSKQQSLVREGSSGVDWPVDAELARRISRNIAKQALLLEKSLWQDTVFESGASSRVKLQNNISHKGTIGTGAAGSIGSYQKAETPIKHHAKAILEFAKSGELPDNPRDQMDVLELTSLLFVLEVERSKTAMLSSPMYLQLLLDEKCKSIKEYPMHPQGAVSFVRAIHHEHVQQLPNSRVLDAPKLGSGAEKLASRFVSCGLTLHPDKTRLVYCNNSRYKLGYPHRKFDFLGYTFRDRWIKNPKTEIMFLGFNPGVSKSAIKSMRARVRSLGIRNRSDLNLEQIGNILNPILRGWLEYYGKFGKENLDPMLRHINLTLMSWAMKKYEKKVRGKTQAAYFLRGIAKRQPELFEHWKRGMAGVFA